MIRSWLMVSLALGALCWAQPAVAQIVNVQPLLGSKTSDGLTGELTGALSWKTGSVDLLLGKVGLLATYRYGAHRFISSSRGELGVKGGEDFMERYFSHLRHQIAWNDRLTIEVFGQLASDRFKRMSLRALAGAGPRVRLFQNDNLDFALGAAYMFEREVLGESSEADSGATENNHRLTSYLTGTVQIGPTLRLVHTTYFQPKLDEFTDDLRVLSQSHLVVKLTDTLSLVTGFVLSWDSRPPIGVSELDTSTDLKLAFGF